MPIALHDLMAPQFLLGATLPAQVDDYLRAASLDDVHVCGDELTTVYRGRLTFGPSAGPREHRDPRGGVFRWEDVTADFRLVVPREAGGFVSSALAATAGDTRRQEVTDALDALGPSTGVATDYPTPAFRLEILLTALTVHLGDDWRPGRLDQATRRVVRDEAADTDDVRFLLPKVALVLEQGDTLGAPPTFALEGWGSSGLDAATGAAAGELVRMDPPLAVHRDGKVGFGVGSVVVDLDPAATPPEILELFGADEGFEGFLVEDARFYYGDRDAAVSVGVGVRDLLVGFDGTVSFDAEVDLIAPTGMQVDLSFHDGQRRLAYQRDPERPPRTDRTGRTTVPPDSTLHVTVSRGRPPYQVTVTRSGTEVWDAGTRSARLTTSDDYVVTVLDSADPQQSWLETVDVTVAGTPAAPAAGAPADRVPDPAGRPTATFALTGTLPAGFSFTHVASPDGLVERVRVAGREPVTVKADGQPLQLTGGVAEVTVPEGGTVTLSVDWPAQTGNAPPYDLLFDRGKPADAGPATVEGYASGRPVPADAQFTTTLPGLQGWLQHNVDPAQPLSLDGHASHERDDRAQQDLALSERRLAVAQAVLADLTAGGVAVPPVPSGNIHAHGFADAKAAANAPSPQAWRKVRFTGAGRSLGQVTATATLTRPARTSTPAPALPVPAAPPVPEPNQPPSAIRDVGVRVKVERNTFVLLELRVGLDLETDLEKRLRGRTGNTSEAVDTSGELDASNDGRVDAFLTVVHDPATHTWTERLAVAAAPGDLDGLVTVPETAPTSSASTALVNGLGAVLVFAPVLNAATGALPDDATGDWVALGSVLGAATLGVAGVLRTERITLYGAELRFRQAIPPGTAPASFTSAGIIFDYGVEFGVKIDLIGLETTRPLKVRYRAIGFDLAFAPDGLTYQPVFDTSKGFELDLSDPGLFRLPSPLSEILAVVGARVAKVNPTTVEVDLAVKADLGVVTVDRFTVRVPLEDPTATQILPSGVRVNVPSTIVGSGWLEIISPPAEPPPDGMSSSGFEGGVDVSFVPMKLRIAADIGILGIDKDGRRAVAVFFGLVVDFPRPLPLGQSGIGIFSGSALFAMHYRRKESAASDASPIPPALRWLKWAGGDPRKLRGTDDAGGPVTLWEPAFDAWAFGLGLGLTTMDGLLVTLRGMVVLELPGPRVLVFSKLSLVVPVNDLRGKSQDLDVGVLGVLDLDLGRRRITLGLLVSFEIKSLLEVEVPVELFFNLQDVEDWHLHLGTFHAPASATVLGIVGGRAYFQVRGLGLGGWPGRPGLPSTPLPGVAAAVGVAGSIVIGDQSSGLYATVAAFADLAASLEPFLVLGFAGLDGELRLWVVGVGVSGTLEIQAPDPTYIRGELCASVDLWLKTLKGCVEIEIGSKPAPSAPDLVSGVALLSHFPVLTAGQGTDRPIDTSLGNATTTPTDQPVVPIDAVPLVQMIQSPVVGAGLVSFTEHPGPSPILRPDGRYQVGAGRAVRYTLTAVSLSPGLTGTGTPPATWRPTPAQAAESAQTGIDLALMSTEPMAGARALERSTELTENVEATWSDVCWPVAPATCVLWTWCGQQVGPSDSGWELTGTARPDPPGTFRTMPPDTALEVVEPPAPVDVVGDALAGRTDSGATDPARVLGPSPVLVPTEPEEPQDGGEECDAYAPEDIGQHRNPLRRTGMVLHVLDLAGRPVGVTRVVQWGRYVGLDVSFRTEVRLAAPARQVTVTAVSFARPLQARASDRNGRTVATAAGTLVSSPETLVLTAPGIAVVTLVASSDETLLLRVCTVSQRGGGIPERPTRPGRPVWPDRPVWPGRPLRPELLRTFPPPRPVPGREAVRSSVGPDQTCLRALQLPRHAGWDAGELDEETVRLVAAAAGAGGDTSWVDLVLGECEQVQLLLAGDRGTVVVEWRDPSGKVLASHPLADLSPVAVTAPAQLPAGWQAEPWRRVVADAWRFLDDVQVAALSRWHVEVPGVPGATTLRVAHPAAPKAQVVVSVVEACTRAEAARHDHDERVQQNRQATVDAAIEGVSTVPLLLPATDYTLSITYTPEVIGEGGSTGSPRTQAFHFSTDAQPPQRLEPYVLGTMPYDTEDFVFWGDSCTLVFNDLQVLALYQAYGRTLRYELRTADGRLPAAGAGSTLVEVPQVVGSPLQEALREVAAAAGDCVGHVTGEGHGSWQIPGTFEPLMAYTLDVLAVTGSSTTGGDRVLRRAFRTSRYRDVDALATAVRTRPLRHRLLTAELTLPADVLTDRELQDSLVAAGEEALPAPVEGGLVLYWAPTATGSARPHALLLDAAEPLWRSRPAPLVEDVPHQPDPAYKRVVPGTEPSLQVTDTSTGLPAPGLRLVRSTAGARTVAVLPPLTGWSDVTLRLRLQRPASELYQTAEASAVMAEVTLDPVAPWEAAP